MCTEFYSTQPNNYLEHLWLSYKNTRLQMFEFGCVFMSIVSFIYCSLYDQKQGNTFVRQLDYMRGGSYMDDMIYRMIANAALQNIIHTHS